MSYETILVEQKGAVTLVTLNRPQALNALNSAVLKELIAAFAAYDADRGAALPGPDRLRKGLRRGRRHQGNAGTGLRRHVSAATSSPAGNTSPRPASRGSRRSPASRWAAAAKWR